MKPEIIPAKSRGVTGNHDLRVVDKYVEVHVQCTPTKYATEDRAACPPTTEVRTAQRTMAADHRNTYGDFGNFAGHEFDLEMVQRLTQQYLADMFLVPEIYGAKSAFGIQDYFNVGVERHFSQIVQEIEANCPPESVPISFVFMINSYAATFNLESWKAARFVIRLVKSDLHMLQQRLEIMSNNNPGRDVRELTREIFFEYVHNGTFKKHLGEMTAALSDNSNISTVFSQVTKDGDTGVNPDLVHLQLFELDFKYLQKTYHLGERPYDKTLLTRAQQLLNEDPYLKTALLVFQMELVQYIAGYLSFHPERLAHTFEFYTELFLTAENEVGELRLIANPKLMRVISRNVVPAITQMMLADGSYELTPKHIEKGVVLAKELLLFQTMIGEFHSVVKGNLECVALHDFIPQTCPAMFPFSKALMEVLPAIFARCKEQQISVQL